MFARSAERHGFTIDAVLYAYTHNVQWRTGTTNGDFYLKFTGQWTDRLIPLLEVVLVIRGDTMIIFHVAALTDNFWDKEDQR